MTIEQASAKEAVQPGQLLFLGHPGSEHFSGYGLTTHVGRPDRLVGLLMVDRPEPVDSAWLTQVEQLYGDAQLLPMTASGERGMLAQMRIEAESLPFLQPTSQPVANDLTQALTPLLDEPPAPVLKLGWDQEQQLWRSDFWIGLSPDLQAVFDKLGYGCLAVDRNDGTTAFVTHVPDADMPGLRQAPVRWRWELVEMPSAPVIRFRAAFQDNPNAPYLLEHFLNVDDRDQARTLSKLVTQDRLVFDFYDGEYEYRYSKEIAHPEAMQEELTAVVRQAIEIYGAIPQEARDFDRAKADFQRQYPV